MAGVPTAEKPPEGISAEWLGVWRHALKVLKAQETWKWEQRPLLDEYVFALRQARTARLEAEQDPFHETDKGLLHPHPGFAIHDRSTRRAVELAKVLKLTPEEQGRLSCQGEADPEDPMDALEHDELAPRRAARST